ncbi:SIMPL domain-containing protein [Deinococcus multiflagellatus]|uniref:SIMPL domain-containing protein n=1 Tax=Deinococcus multiflagellatus TaxID=1656887 RepID=A0ABW1ZI51_9DEIO|nr:SIMPL domain-containing protein [Deinococcus multiflagellatus]MBZ9711724.1 SIMPL domain-containing protein [Deinococcus multiflagellatus]
MTPASRAGLSAVLATAIASAAFLATGFVVVRGLADLKNASDVINVTGSARRSITSDLAVWTFTVRSASDSSLQSAYAQFRAAQPALDAYVKAQGFAPGELRREPVSAGPETYSVIETIGGENEEVQRTRYVVSQAYRVQSGEIERVQSAVGAATSAFVEASTGGVTVASGEVNYLYTKLADVRLALLKEASQDAQRRAQAIAQSAGNEVGAVKTARMGVFQITPRFETSVEDSGSYDTSSLEKDVTAVVEIDFVVQ